MQGENQQASNSSSYQNALATQATSALSNATGVNLDAEMTIMLNLENAYASTAKLLTTVTSMFSVPPAGRMMTMSANFVSTQYLANSLVAPVMQAQSSLTKAMTELSTGQYADLGLQLGDQSGYELSLKEQVQPAPDADDRQQRRRHHLSTAQDALTLDRHERPDDHARSCGLDSR